MLCIQHCHGGVHHRNAPARRMKRRKLTLDVKPEWQKTLESPAEKQERQQRGTLDQQARWMALADAALGKEIAVPSQADTPTSEIPQSRKRKKSSS